MKSPTLLLSLLLLPLVADSTPPTLGKDLIADGFHRIKFVVTVDAAAVSSCLCRAYQIEPGDTYGEIARRECGDVSCRAEIRLLNPEANPEKLRPGDYLRIPPRAAATDSRATTRGTDGGPSCWVPFVVQWSRGRKGAKPSAVVEGEPIPEMGRGEFRVLAVPREKLLWFLTLDWNQVPIDNPPDGVAWSEIVVPTWVLPEADPAITVEKRITLRPAKDQRLAFDVEERRFDKKGKLLSQNERAPKGASLPSLPVAAIGISALLGVIGIARRRRAGTDGGRAA